MSVCSMKVFLLLSCILWVVASATKKIPDNKLHTANLDKKGAIQLNWLIDWPNEQVFFYVKNALELSTGHNLFYIGFSQRGNVPNSDLCLFQRLGFNDIVTDAYTTGDGTYINKDRLQHCELLRMTDNYVAFKRKFDTCDPEDFRFHEGTMYVMWGRGNTFYDLPPTIEFSSLNISESDVNTMQLLRADKITVPEEKITLSTDINLDDVEIPSKDTTYYCKIQKLPPVLQQHKHHIVQFEPLINSTLHGAAYMFTHHMEVFHCEAPVDVEIPLYSGDCNSLPAAAEVCKRVITLWAMGASVFTYPPEAGLPIGGKDYNPYIRIEVHFNNPEMLQGGRDSSGMRIRYVQKLRKYDAQVMELGLEYTDKMAIPPGQIGFPLSGYCIPECTGIALPPSGITVFGSQLHTHLRGVRILTRHLRGDKELTELNRDDFYSHHFQEMRTLRRKPKVLPGDALVTTCYYDTQGYKNATLGGFSIQDEMCVNYIHYYPATELELCKSSVSERTLEHYFEFMRETERQRIRERAGRSENYKAIRWTDTRVMELFSVYTQEPLSMQCNRSDGFRFEGYEWEGAPITPVKVQLLSRGDEVCQRDRFWKKPIEDGLCDLLGECIY